MNHPVLNDSCEETNERSSSTYSLLCSWVTSSLWLVERSVSLWRFSAQPSVLLQGGLHSAPGFLSQSSRSLAGAADRVLGIGEGRVNDPTDTPVDAPGDD